MIHLYYLGKSNLEGFGDQVHAHSQGWSLDQYLSRPQIIMGPLIT